MRDIEGKVAREAMSECGQLASFKAMEELTAQLRCSIRQRNVKCLDATPFSQWNSSLPRAIQQRQSLPQPSLAIAC